MMYRAIRKTLVLSMTITLTFGPSLAALADGCGCGQVYSAPVYDTWSSDCWGCSPCYVETCHDVSDCGSVSACDDQSCGCGSSEIATAQGESCGCGSTESVTVHEDSCGCGAENVTVHDHMHTEVAKPSVEEVPEVHESITPQPTLEPQEKLADPKPIPPQETFDEPKPVEETVDNAVSTPVTPPAVDLSPIEPTEPASDPQPVEMEESEDDFGSMFDEPEAAPTEEPEPVIEETETTEEPEESMFDDMFDEPAETTETESPENSPAESTEEPAESEDSEDDFDDLFGSDLIPAELRVAGGLHSTQSRHWTDNTARYHCQARLVSLATDAIVIEKTDGSMKRVPLRRLSETDAQFVQGQLIAQQEMLAKRGGAKKLVSQLSK